MAQNQANKLKQLRALRQMAINQMQELSDIGAQLDSSPMLLAMFKVRYTRCNQILLDFQSHHIELVSLLAITGGELDAEEVIRSDFMRSFYDIEVSFNLHCPPVGPTNLSVSTTSVEAKANIKLPKIELPQFSGKFQEWPAFRDLFSTLIHQNTGLSNIEKFQYLQSCLKGEAAGLIRGVHFSTDNYSMAYETINKFYNSPRKLASSYWDTILRSKLDSRKSLRHLVNTYVENLAMLEQLDYKVEGFSDFIVFHSLFHKLEPSIREAFERQLGDSTKVPTFIELREFLEVECRAIDAAQIPRERASHTYQAPRAQSCVANSVPVTKACVLCKGAHFLQRCSQFMRKSTAQRLEFVRERKHCTNCLGDHRFSDCPSTGSCRCCGQRHHTLLHFENRNANPPLRNSENNIPSNRQINQPIRDSESSSNSHNSSLVATPVVPTESAANALTTHSKLPAASTSTLLSTAALEVADDFGNYHRVRALIDPGSQVSFMTDRLANRLALRRSLTNIPILGIGRTPTRSSGGQCTTSLRAVKCNQILDSNFYILSHICGNLPSSKVSPTLGNMFRNLPLADPSWHQPGPIDLLLGADLYPSILKPGLVQGSTTGLTAIATIFGWVLIGPIAANSISIHSFLSLSELPLDSTLRAFWEVEEIPTSVKARWSTDDIEVDKFYSETKFRLPNGRFGVSLPVKETCVTFPKSKEFADRRLLALERRLSSQPELYKHYVDFMKEYLEAGHMELVSTSITDPRAYFLPHHAIMKYTGEQVKLRVVFDASARAANGKSLNDILSVGPKLQPDIASILLGFRQFAFVFSCDIRQMYRQILVSSSDCIYQYIRWRFSPDDEIKTFQLKTITYGISCSPYLAIRTLLQLAEEAHSHLSLAANAIRNHLYVDDFLCGANSHAEALELRNQLISLLLSGGFELRKWATNQTSLLSGIPEEHKQSSLHQIFDNDTNVHKILGLMWQSQADTFSFKVKIEDKPCTKRNILSEIAKIFDPLGFLAPLTLGAKRLIQHLWVTGLDWDETPPVDICERWEQYLQELPLISSVSVPRHLPVSLGADCQIHGFCDASESGYAGVIYLRTILDSEVSVKLITAKSKVAPLKRTSIPRLELCAAVLLSKLIAFVQTTFSTSLHSSQIFAWSDSTVALSWIRSSPHRWKTYVANRVALIQEHTSPDRWFHVSSTCNPADPASRGLLPGELMSCSLWWAGPDFLMSTVDSWPDQTVIAPLQSVVVEERLTVLTAQLEENTVIDGLLNDMSSLIKIQSVVAYCLRIVQFPKSSTVSLSANELHQALMRIVFLIQRQVFKQEVHNIQMNLPCSRSLRKLSPFLDDNGILRVGGRLRHSQLAYSAKHPALLPGNHKFTELLIKKIHNDYPHPGVNTTLYLIQENFWILGGRQHVRRVLSKCLTCFRLNPKPYTPPMADLPAIRVSQIKPFSSVGVDFGGPYSITLNRHRGTRTTKAYICIFICMSVKAIHIELVSGLSAEAFLAALRRFVARRGRCSRICSDNGTNFVAANRELNKHFRAAAQQEQICWSFIPPSAPHFGGLWENGIKSVKTHLNRVLGSQILTYEEFYTLLTQVEALLNSRPLSPLSSDPNDLSALTPGHFLTLEPLTAVPEPDLTDHRTSQLSRWQMVQKMQQQFWDRWHKDYLHTLLQRSKWYQTKAFEAVHVGTLVLIKEDSRPPLSWRLGRIIQLFPGRDNICRVAEVQTAQGILKRPLTKLCALPINY